MTVLMLEVVRDFSFSLNVLKIVCMSYLCFTHLSHMWVFYEITMFLVHLKMSPCFVAHLNKLGLGNFVLKRPQWIAKAFRQNCIKRQFFFIFFYFISFVCVWGGGVRICSVGKRRIHTIVDKKVGAGVATWGKKECIPLLIKRGLHISFTERNN